MQTSRKQKSPWRLPTILGLTVLLAGCAGPPPPGYVGTGPDYYGPDYYGSDYYDNGYGYGWPYALGPDVYVFGHHDYGHHENDFGRRGFESRSAVGVGGFHGGVGHAGGGGFHGGGGGFHGGGGGHR